MTKSALNNDYFFLIHCTEMYFQVKEKESYPRTTYQRN